MMMAWPQAAADELRLWIGAFGAFGAGPPPLPQILVNGAAAVPLAPLQWQAIRDRHEGADGQPAHWQMQARLRADGPGRAHRVAIAAAAEQAELTVRTLPAEVPAVLGGSFNILLSSCYFRPEDAGALLGRIVQQIPQRVDLTLLAGDQIYGDLPLFEDLPEDEPGLSRMLGDKYRRNWLNGLLGGAGLQPLLQRAPTACIPDDHEYWNNYPYRQAQLPNTWCEGPRQRWQAAAQALYEDWQCGGAPATAPAALRLDVAPLAMLVLDSRSRRGEVPGDAASGLLDDKAIAALDTWRQDLLAARSVGRPQVGLLATGQALFVQRPEGAAVKFKDAELANYAQFERIERALDELSAAGVPVVFVTGDVHWGRVAQARRRAGGAALTEVICSPSRLIATPGADAKAQGGNAIKSALSGLFGAVGRDSPLGSPQVWPRHPDPETPPPRFGPGNGFATEALHRQKGDQVALLQFARSGRGLSLAVTYYPIHADAAVARPVTVGPLPLQPV